MSTYNTFIFTLLIYIVNGQPTYVENISLKRFYMASAVIQDNFALFAGGSGGNPPCSNIDMYDASTNTWNSSMQLSYPRFGISSVSVGTKAYFAGGTTPSYFF